MKRHWLRNCVKLTNWHRLHKGSCRQPDQSVRDLTGTIDAGQRSLYFQTLNSAAFSIVVLFLEFWNLHHEWQARAQFRRALEVGGKDGRPGALVWLFPAPPIRNGKADTTTAPAMSFNQTDAPFWADEKTHAES